MQVHHLTYVNGNQLTITNPTVFLGNGAKVKVIATLTRTVASEKTKTKQSSSSIVLANNVATGTIKVMVLHLNIKKFHWVVQMYTNYMQS